MEPQIERRETTKKVLRPLFANFKPEIAIQLSRPAFPLVPERRALESSAGVPNDDRDILGIAS